MSYVLRNHRRYEPQHGVTDAPDTYVCAICGNYIDWPAEAIGRNTNDEICHEKCMEDGYGDEYSEHCAI